MSNERPNEFLSWRRQLTAPDTLSEMGVDDKEQSWQRLAERLQKQPRRRGIAWWIAAACLILAFFFPATHLFRTRPTRPNRVAFRPSVQRQPVTQPQPMATIQPEPAPAPSHAASTPRHHVPAAQRHLTSTSIYGEIAPIASPPSTPIPAPRLADDPLLATIAPPASKASTAQLHHPLRIVYLNEISKDPGQSPDPAFRQPAFLHLSTATAGDWSVNPNPAPIIKIDISSHNH